MLVYCDYIAHRIRRLFLTDISSNEQQPVGEPATTGVDTIKFDLYPSGAFKSPKKTLRVKVEDKWYKITVEEDEQPVDL